MQVSSCDQLKQWARRIRERRNSQNQDLPISHGLRPVMTPSWDTRRGSMHRHSSLHRRFNRVVAVRSIELAEQSDRRESWSWQGCPGVRTGIVLEKATSPRGHRIHYLPRLRLIGHDSHCFANLKSEKVQKPALTGQTGNDALLPTCDSPTCCRFGRRGWAVRMLTVSKMAKVTSVQRVYLDHGLGVGVIQVDKAEASPRH